MRRLRCSQVRALLKWGVLTKAQVRKVIRGGHVESGCLRRLKKKGLL